MEPFFVHQKFRAAFLALQTLYHAPYGPAVFLNDGYSRKPMPCRILKISLQPI